MSLRVVLLAEGSGETGGELSLRPAPRVELQEAHLGAAHFLVRRALSRIKAIAEGAIRFEEPLRPRARLARGNDLLHKQTLRRLLSWPRSRPDLAIVLVDADGETQRRQLLAQHIDGLDTCSVVIAIAIQEFEAWLVADHETAKQPTPPSVEDMKCGEAKALFAQWLATAGEHLTARRDFARTCDLDRIAKRAPSFAQFLRDLSA